MPIISTILYILNKKSKNKKKKKKSAIFFKYTHDLQEQNFLANNCFRFANVMNNTTKINIFDSDNSNIACIKTRHVACTKTRHHDNRCIHNPEIQNYD